MEPSDATAAASSSAATLLERGRGELVRRWIERVHRRRDADDPAPPELLDSVPEFLDGLIDALRRPDPTPGLDDAARARGVRRGRPGCDVDAVVREYGLLGEVIFDMLEESGHTIPLPALRVIGRALAAGVAEAVARFAAARERALRVSDAERAQALDALEYGDAFLLLDRDYRVVLVNSSQERLAHKPREESLGRVLWELWPETASPDLTYAAHYRRCMEERVPVAFEEYFSPLDLWTEVTAYPTKSGGIAVFFRDVSARKRTEAALRVRQWELDRVFALSPDLLCIAGLDGRLRRVNPAFTALLGHDEATLLSTPLLDLVHPDERAATCDELARLARGESTWHYPCRFRRRDGTYRWLSWRASPDPGGQLFVAVARDITEEKARADFERQLIGVVSHDLRNPLAAIAMSATAALRRGAADEPTTRALTRICSSAGRATRLIEDLLDSTQARAEGHFPLRPAASDLDPLVREAVEEAERAFPGRTIRTDIAGPTTGRWDPDRLAQVLSNLLTNALKFSPADTTVTVRTRGSDDAVVLEVHNWGPPIAPERLPTIFEAFQRGDPSSGARASLGLGLHISRQIVLAHAGRIDVASTADAGTTLTVRLPRRGP